MDRRSTVGIALRTFDGTSDRRSRAPGCAYCLGWLVRSRHGPTRSLLSIHNALPLLLELLELCLADSQVWPRTLSVKRFRKQTKEGRPSLRSMQVLSFCAISASRPWCRSTSVALADAPSSRDLTSCRASSSSSSIVWLIRTNWPARDRDGLVVGEYEIDDRLRGEWRERTDESL